MEFWVEITNVETGDTKDLYYDGFDTVEELADDLTWEYFDGDYQCKIYSDDGYNYHGTIYIEKATRCWEWIA